MKDVELHLGDCLDVMGHIQDDFADLCLTDPPYGLKMTKGQGSGKLATAKVYIEKTWDDKIPDQICFHEIKRISKEQVIFGGNYFAEYLGNSPSWIVWDKDNGANDFADCELAWTSHKTAVRKIVYRWNGMLQEPGFEKNIRVHPTQKPVEVMVRLLEMFSKAGDTIIDPYMGSGTSGVACVRMGRKFIGIELDPEYYAMAEKRIQDEIDRFGLFNQKN